MNALAPSAGGEVGKTPWDRSLSVSTQAFEAIVKPKALELLAGEFEVVEGVTSYRVAKALDQLAGIDLWHVNTKSGIRGVASRVQFGPNWRTFTVRKSRESGAHTEYEKRVDAIAKEYLYPVLTLQAYVTKPNGRLLGVGIAKTRDVLAMIEHGCYRVQTTRSDQNGRSEFYVVRWGAMAASGYRVLSWGAENAAPT